ncbi:MAG: SLBB domain-containing protein [Bacteroidota bacterium]|nr:SLBB domain-containing protein [Bacteroidota bacterium]
MVKFFRIFCFAFFFLGLSVSLQAQQLPISVEALSDQQLIQLIGQYQLSGLSEAELEAKAKEKGLSTDQILLLKKRISLLDPSLVGGTTTVNKVDTYTERNKTYIKPPSIKKKDSTGVLEVFGADIFDNADLSFEPNLAIATPSNYVLGVNDQLIIDVYGLSENTRKLKVTNEGDVRFPNLGPVKVEGLTVEEAEQKLRKALAGIYPGIQAGKTFVKVSLGQIRSIHVTLIGEVKRPGRYTVSSLSTIMNALYASGGPSDIGSFRDIKLVRNGKAIVIFDLYDFLLNGDLSKNKMLQDEDVIKVGTYTTRVALKGAVKKQAIYEIKSGESAYDVFNYAGGFSDNGYKDLIRVIRMGNAQREVLTIKANQLKNFTLQSGDTLAVDTLSTFYNNRVLINGAVYYRGAYGITDFPSLQSLLKAARLREDAYMEHGIVRRYRPDFTPEMIDFNVKDIVDGKQSVLLQKEDSVYIYKFEEVREKYTVTINGEVNKPGIYPYFENMSITDLVLQAGGYTDAASSQNIEIARRIRSKVAGKDTMLYAIVKEIDMAALNQPKEALAYILSPFDVVSIRRSPNYKEQITVTIEGEVMYPGKYALMEKVEKLSDILKRAGGLKQTADASSAILVRQSYVHKSETDMATVNSKLGVINKQGKREVLPINTDTAQLKNSLQSLYKLQKPVGIRLLNALQHPGSKDDLLLEEGDVIKVPKMVQTVQTFGAVNVPQQIAFSEGERFGTLIKKSGGFALHASRKRSYVIYANGEVKSTRKFLFFYSYPVVKRGAEIYIPFKPERKGTSTIELVGIGSSLASLAGLVIALINATK